MKLVDDPAIVIANHQSTADVPTMMYALQAKKNAIKDIMWIQDMILRYLDFGWVSLVHGDFFIEQVISGMHFAQELNVTTDGSTNLGLVYMEQIFVTYPFKSTIKIVTIS